jgi:hypothetical protein
MRAYKELDDRIKHFSDQLEAVIIRPRIELKLGNLSSIEIRSVSRSGKLFSDFFLTCCHRTPFVPQHRMEISL